MKIFSCIDGLFVGTRYLVLGLALLGIIGSLVLFCVNIPLGLASAAVFISTFFLALGVSLLLFPRKSVKGIPDGKKRYLVSVVSLVVSFAAIGIVYASIGGFPPLNLIFMS